MSFCYACLREFPTQSALRRHERNCPVLILDAQLQDVLEKNRRLTQQLRELRQQIKNLKSKCGPLDPNRLRKYCGNSDSVPQGYARRGSPYECLRKGVKTGYCEAVSKLNV